MDPDVTVLKTGFEYPGQTILKQDITIKAAIAGDEDKATGTMTVECDQILGTSRPQALRCGRP
jgi:hypothetical protein